MRPSATALISTLLSLDKNKPYSAKVADHFLHKRSHGCNINDLELVSIDCSVWIDVLADLSHHTQHSHVGFTSTLELKINQQFYKF
jgi:hypothetical protein